MVQGFGLLLVAGIAVALIVALTAGSAALVLGDRSGGPVGASLRGARDLLGPAGRGAGRLVRGAGCEPGVGRSRRERADGIDDAASGTKRTAPLVWTLGSAAPLRPDRQRGLIAAVAAHPGRVLAVAAVLAFGGWIADTQTSVQSDVTKLVPANMPALRNLRTLENVTGVSGEIDVTVRGANVATPAVVGLDDPL